MSEATATAISSVPKATASAPVMDVVAPTSAKPADEPKDDMAVHEQSTPTDDPADVLKEESAKPEAQKKPAPKPVPAKQHHSSSTLAIVAAVIIILGLGAMFTYAYLRSQNISVF